MGIAAIFRLSRAGFVLAREGVISALPKEGLSGIAAFAYRIAKLLARRQTKKQDRAENMARAINKLGPSYIKLGQFLATRPDIVGASIAKDLTQLQDKVHTFPTKAALQKIEESLGRKVDDLFIRFDPPIAGASMAQVHPAFIKDAHNNTRKVAVKVIRPDVRARFQKDLDSFYWLARLQARYVKNAQRLKPLEVVATFAHSTKLEMDLRLEAAALSEMQENTQNDKGFRVPRVDWERTGRDVLTMEWVDGLKLSDPEAIKEAGHDLDALAITLIQSFLRHSLRDGFFHADMHPGNLFVDKSGTIVAVDLGITGRLGKKEKYFLAQILYGFITRDYQRVARAHFEGGYVPAYHSRAAFAQANRAIGEPIHGQSAETISMAKLLTLLFEVTELFDMETRPELLLLQKTMVVVEGVARSLSPQFNMWKAAEPVVKEWIGQNLGPAGVAKDLYEGSEAVLKLVHKTPQIIDNWQNIQAGLLDIAQNGLTLEEKTLQKLARAKNHQKRSQTYALWLIALCLIILTIKLF